MVKRWLLSHSSRANCPRLSHRFRECRPCATTNHTNVVSHIDRRALLGAATSLCIPPVVKAAHVIKPVEDTAQQQAQQRVQDYFDELLVRANDALQAPIYARLVWCVLDNNLFINNNLNNNLGQRSTRFDPRSNRMPPSIPGNPSKDVQSSGMVLV